MILSMTGFGRGTAVRNGREITVELRSVNSRYFEYSSRIPRTCSYLDSRLKKQLNERITRGKVSLSMKTAFWENETLSGPTPSSAAKASASLRKTASIRAFPRSATLKSATTSKSAPAHALTTRRSVRQR